MAYRNSNKARLMSGYIYIMGGGAITWMSQKQTMVTVSMTKAEYIMLSEASCKACWLRNLFEELGRPTVIHRDNNRSVVMVRNPQFHQHVKHIETKWHQVRDLIEREIVSIVNCRDPEQMADILTKALAHPKHKHHVEEMGIALM